MIHDPHKKNFNEPYLLKKKIIFFRKISFNKFLNLIKMLLLIYFSDFSLTLILPEHFFSIKRAGLTLVSQD